MSVLHTGWPKYGDIATIFDALFKGFSPSKSLNDLSNFSRFRKAQQEFEETEERTKMADAQMSMLRSQRAGSFF